MKLLWTSILCVYCVVSVHTYSAVTEYNSSGKFIAHRMNRWHNQIIVIICLCMCRCINYVFVRVDGYPITSNAGDSLQTNALS